MQARYRSDYAGEFIVLETKWSGGKKQQSREWVANPIENHHISGRAVCIGSTSDQYRFDYTRLQRHRGGLLGSKKLQTYGVGTIAQQMRLDFTVETNPDLLQNLQNTGYSEHNIVYTTASNCIKFPQYFYLIPYNPGLLDICAIVYLAAFDEHKEIFLLGYHAETLVDRPDWHMQIKKIIDAYPAVKFYFVGESTNMFDEWSDSANVEFFDYRKFISYCDV